MTSNFIDSKEHAQLLDNNDPLAEFRPRFSIPKMDNGKQEVYLCGNSLGLQGDLSRQYVEDELNKWGTLGVRGHFESNHPWMPYHEFLAPAAAKFIGAKESEVVSMNSLTANLHFMMVSFYQPTATRNKILIEEHAFPSDTYAVESQIKFHGFDPAECMLKIAPRQGEELIRDEDLFDLLEQQGEQIALVMLPGVQYYTGQVLPMQAITKLAQTKGCKVGFDLAHATGNIPMQMHRWNVDFACWCHYKYLNSGPGAVGGCFVHQNHHQDIDMPRFAGWWGHDKSTRFKMGSEFQPIQSAEAWQLSNPPILSLASIRGASDIFIEAGGIEPLRQKSVKLTNYMEFLLNKRLEDKIEIITPSNVEQRGCQLSIVISTDQPEQHLTGRQVFDGIEAAGVTADWREPNVIRVAPVPLYNNFADVYEFVEILEEYLTS